MITRGSAGVPEGAREFQRAVLPNHHLLHTRYGLPWPVVAGWTHGGGPVQVGEVRDTGKEGDEASIGL